MTAEHEQGHERFAYDHKRRIEELERFVAQQGTSISTVIQSTATLLTRIEKLESLAQARAITEAREDERDKALYARLDRMDDAIEKARDEIQDIRGIGAKALWVFISAIILAITTFLIKGGFAL